MGGTPPPHGGSPARCSRTTAKRLAVAATLARAFRGRAPQTARRVLVRRTNETSQTSVETRVGFAHDCGTATRRSSQRSARAKRIPRGAPHAATTGGIDRGADALVVNAMATTTTAPRRQPQRDTCRHSRTIASRSQRVPVSTIPHATRVRHAIASTTKADSLMVVSNILFPGSGGPAWLWRRRPEGFSPSAVLVALTHERVPTTREHATTRDTAGHVHETLMHCGSV